ncbi:hypothetical protein SAMN04488121_101498 [Chitinophaga filiformis]|uniref:Uncharacterized protein n=1 Tax=Chitinophaga filiformis TaxID=104663 RepID=A0A1G7HJU2_CHIFI|nr:hypothetical protein SAMN04488121_101498 [Chitinophaga filiformis]
MSTFMILATTILVNPKLIIENYWIKVIFSYYII